LDNFHTIFEELEDLIIEYSNNCQNLNIEDEEIEIFEATMLELENWREKIKKDQNELLQKEWNKDSKISKSQSKIE